jgi:hypothetical protein
MLNHSFEYIVQMAMEFSKKEGSDRVRVLKLVRNRGKGGAVKCVRTTPKIHHVFASS